MAMDDRHLGIGPGARPLQRLLLRPTSGETHSFPFILKIMPRRYAAADIGSNTVHLLVGEFTQPKSLRRLVNESEWFSLGEKVSRHGHVPESDILKLIETLKRFRKDADDLGASQIYLFATEAMRTASNHTLVLKRIKKEAGLHVQIVPPRREAALCVKGMTLDCDFVGNSVVIEIGGGSAQVAQLHGAHIHAEFSLPIGTGKLKNICQLTQPTDKNQMKSLEAQIDEAVAPVSELTSAPIFASGGISRGLVRALHPDGEPVLQQYELDYLRASVQRLDISQISKRFRVKPKRAETLLAGTLILQKFLNLCKQTQIRVSEYGVREGAVLESYEADVRQAK